MNTLLINGTPFTNLRMAYFRVYDQKHEKHFLDATDEQILNLLAKEYGETVFLTKIEDIEVMDVITVIPKKRKLDIDELKSGISFEEREKIASKIQEYKDKYK